MRPENSRANPLHNTTADLNHDGRTEIIASSGASGSLVRVFDGQSGEKLLGFNLPHLASPQGIVVTAVDVNQDRFLDIVAVSPTTGQVKVLDGQTIAAQLFQRKLAQKTREQLQDILRTLRGF